MGLIVKRNNAKPFSDLEFPITYNYPRTMDAQSGNILHCTAENFRPNFSDIFDLCLHWMSVVRDIKYLSALFQALNIIKWKVLT